MKVFPLQLSNFISSFSLFDTEKRTLILAIGTIALTVLGRPSPSVLEAFKAGCCIATIKAIPFGTLYFLVKPKISSFLMIPFFGPIGFGMGVFRLFKTQSFKNHPHPSAIVACLREPIVEEVLFRGVIQTGIAWTVQKFFTKNPFISIVAANVLLSTAYLHNKNPLKIFQFISINVEGLVYGVLREKYGVFSAILAHATSNTMIQTCSFH